VDGSGNPLPFNERGIFNIPVVMEPDGISFAVSAVFLDKLPVEFVKGGSPLAHVQASPVVEWLKGPVVPLGNNRFQLALDRSAGRMDGNQSAIFRTWHRGDPNFRLSVNPGMLQFPINKTGVPQTITFDEIPEPIPGTKEIPLRATSSSGLPVKFFVKAGPAEVRGDKLVFTPVPLRSKLPVPVTVVAWQWGRAAAPAIQTAPVVERTVRLSP
jgi:hypothetical protein